MKNGGGEALLIQEVNQEAEKISFSLDKFTKYAKHLAGEVYDSYGEDVDTRGENHVNKIIDFLYHHKSINDEERNEFYDGSYDLEEVVFILLEKLLLGEFYTTSDYGLNDSGINNSFVFAWNTYMILGRALGKGTQDIPESLKNTPIYPLLLEDKREVKIDRELEEETLEIISILYTRSFETNRDHATMLDDYLNLLGRKGIISQKELIATISTDDIEETLESIISRKLIQTGKIHSPAIITAFHQFSDAFIKRRQDETRKKVDSVFEVEEDEDFEDPLLLKLSQGLTIIQHLHELGGELYDYDVHELVLLTAEMDVITENIAQKLIDALSADIGNKAQVIIEIFEYVFHSGYLDEIDMDNNERGTLKSHFGDIREALNMLYKD